MKKLLVKPIAVSVTILFSACEKKSCYEPEMPDIEITDIGCLTDNVTIGRKLENPYSLRNMKKACDELYPATKGEVAMSDTLITPNTLYVRFLPSDSTDVNKLMDCDYELFNYPLDYEILGDPSDYYDGSVEEGRITWQYTAVPIESELPDVQYEILDVCYIPKANCTNSSAARNVELRAFVNAVGDYNSDPFEDSSEDPSGGIGETPGGTGSYSSSSSAGKLAGKISVSDTKLGIQGVKGIKVRAVSFLKIRTDFTDENGEYAISNDFCLSPRYELRFENKYGFNEGHGIGCLVLPATYNMQDNRYVTISREMNNGQKWWTLATINNAAYDWFKYCEDNGITTPSNDLRIWALTIGSGAATTMFHHGLFKYTEPAKIAAFCAFLSPSPLDEVRLVWLNSLLELIGPDIVVCDTDVISKSYTLYETVCHELAHATHFQQLGTTDATRCIWWADVFDYELGFLSSSVYGDATSSGNGPCGVTEMWAHTMGYYVSDKTYSIVRRDNPLVDTYWFKPEALWDLITEGHITSKQAADCLKPEIRSVDSFVDRLILNNPAKKDTIKYFYYEKY